MELPSEGPIFVYKLIVRMLKLLDAGQSKARSNCLMLGCFKTTPGCSKKTAISAYNQPMHNDSLFLSRIALNVFPSPSMQRQKTQS
jgi:hypothetical protein